MLKNINALIIEDEDDHVEIISRYLRSSKETCVQLTRESRLNSAIERLETEAFDIILLDLQLPDSTIHQTLARTLDFSATAPVIILSSLEGHEFAVKLIHQGAQDYICKADLSTELLLRVMSFAIERKRVENRLQIQMDRVQSLFELSQLAFTESEIPALLCTASRVVAQTLCASVHQLSDCRADTIGIVLARTKYQPCGMLKVIKPGLDQFTEDEIKFLDAASNTIAAAVCQIYMASDLNAKIEELNSAHRRKNEFMATLSHELRTPLNVIVGNVELLKSTPPYSPDFYRALNAIERNARTEEQLISDTLELSQIVTGKMKLKIGEVQPLRLLNAAIEAIQFGAQAKGLSLHRKIASPLRSFAGDEVRLQQLLWNLLSNSVKFTPSGGVISLTATAGERNLEITVADTGKGIAPENLPRVFDRFWQEDSSTHRQYMGMGLGLAIVRHIAELHGGGIEVFSPGAELGTSFTLTIPIDQPYAPPVNESAPREIQARCLNLLKILVVDDSADSLDLLVRLLKMEGASVTARESSLLGLDTAKTEIFDVIVSDIGMPGVDGYEMIRLLHDWEIQNQRLPTPAIALTAFVGGADAAKALAAGFQSHFPKPINFSLLKGAIQTASYRAPH